MKTPCSIDGKDGTVYWEDCYVQIWTAGNENQAPKQIGQLEQRRGKGILSTGETLTFTGVGGKAKRG